MTSVQSPGAQLLFEPSPQRMQQRAQPSLRLWLLLSMTRTPWVKRRSDTIIAGELGPTSGVTVLTASVSGGPSGLAYNGARELTGIS